MLQHLLRLTDTAVTYIRKFRERDLKLKATALAQAGGGGGGDGGGSTGGGNTSGSGSGLSSSASTQANQAYENNSKMIHLDVTSNVNVSMKWSSQVEEDQSSFLILINYH